MPIECEAGERPIRPIMGSMIGVGSGGSGMKETWRTGVVFMIEWTVSAS